ncbi:MAG TPA: hypothetical protein VFW78_01320 [Bacteroidia bacterium]|nr:hypothetical protein [Bacteroidia bacterium]
MPLNLRYLVAILAVFAVVTASSCKKEGSLPVVPQIEFKKLDKYASSFSGIDSLVLTFSFEDGDGDIGTPSSDTITRDIYVTLFEKQNGVFVPIVFPDPTLMTYRLPYLQPTGNNTSLKGDVVISYLGYLIGIPNDTVRYDLYIKDRAGHISNTITSNEIVTTVQ